MLCIGKAAQKASGQLLRQEDLRERQDPAARYDCHIRLSWCHRGTPAPEQLIKEHQPVNIGSDDKTYPSIVIRKSGFPHPFDRNIVQMVGYFDRTHQPRRCTCRHVRKLHPIRTCKYDLSQKNIDAGKFRTCLEYDMGNCKAPCVGKQSQEDYDEGVDAIRTILRGNLKDLIRTYDKAMKDASAAFAFEEAETHKRKKMALEKFQAKSSVQPSIHASRCTAWERPVPATSTRRSWTAASSTARPSSPETAR